MINVKKIVSILAISALTAIIPACSPPDDAKRALPTTSSTPLPNDGSARLLELINHGRAKKRLAPLTPDSRLTQAARDHSVAMTRSQTFAHRVKGQRDFQNRLLHRGYPLSHCAENIAMAGTPEQVYQLWYHSRGHHKNMFHKKLTSVGIARSGNYWTADFAAPDEM